MTICYPPAGQACAARDRSGDQIVAGPSKTPLELTPELLEKIHQTGQEILDAFVKICEENGLRYYLFYGTLLGAARHKGPIPWDDDMDVIMPRQDMERFRELMLARPKGELYHVHCKENDENIPWQYLRFCKSGTVYSIEGVECYGAKCREMWMDIFCLDQTPVNSGWRYKLHCRRIALAKRLTQNRGVITPIHSKVARLAHALLRPVSYQWLKDHTGRLMTSWNRRLGKYYVCWNYIYSVSGETFPMEWFGEGADLPYGGKTYRVPKEWDKVLTQIYGDYMTPPPEEKRRNHGPLEVKL